MLHSGTLHSGTLQNGMLHSGTLQDECCNKTNVVTKQYVTESYSYKTVIVTKRYVLQNGNHYYGLGGRLL
jgi:hypothetical protein